MNELIKIKYEKLYVDISNIKNNFNDIYDKLNDLLRIIKSGLSFNDEIQNKDIFESSIKTLIKTGENIDDLLLIIKNKI